MKENKVLVYFNESALAPKGGPAAVCFYYYLEQKKRGERYFEFMPPKTESCPGGGFKALKLLIPNDLRVLGSAFKTLFFKPDPVQIDFSGYDMVHFHSTDSLYQARTSLESYKGTVVLQSHSPEPRGREIFAAMPSWIRFLFPFLRKGYEKMDKYAFNRADIIVFPCPEAEEPYFHVWPYYKSIHNIKSQSYRYILTGIPEAKATRTKADVLSTLCIPEDAFIITYVGRHNKIKGYDIFKTIAGIYLECDSSAWVICAGVESPIKGLIHQRWKEIGWTTEPHSYINASDVFVLPNRETYFDIIMLELLSLGKIVVASATGGNKWFNENGCPGVFLYHSIDEALKLIKSIKAMSLEERKQLGAQNKDFYERNLTVGRMYDSYVLFLKEVLEDKR